MPGIPTPQHPPPLTPAPSRSASSRFAPHLLAVLLLPTLAATPLPPATPAPPPAPPAPPATPPAPLRLGWVTLDPARRTASIPARINQTNGILEYVLVTDYGKTHESLLVTDTAAGDLQAALLLLNARPAGTNAVRAPAGPPPAASAVELLLRWPPSQPTHQLPIAQAIGLATRIDAGPNTAASLSITNRLTPGPWLFNGSTFSPEGFVAHFEGSLISLIRDPGAILNNPGPDRDDDDIHVPAPGLPPYGTPVLLELTVPRPTP